MYENKQNHGAPLVISSTTAKFKLIGHVGQMNQRSVANNCVGGLQWGLRIGWQERKLLVIGHGWVNHE